MKVVGFRKYNFLAKSSIYPKLTSGDRNVTVSGQYGFFSMIRWQTSASHLDGSEKERLPNHLELLYLTAMQLISTLTYLGRLDT